MTGFCRRGHDLSADNTHIWAGIRRCKTCANAWARSKYVPTPRPIPIDRFMAKVEPEPNSGCWLWAASVQQNGYAQFGVGPRSTRSKVIAHRFAYQHFVGPIPAGLEIDHICNTRCCVNPAHLRAVTHQQNQQHMARRKAARA